jgi:hypothetical protein
LPKGGIVVGIKSQSTLVVGSRVGFDVTITQDVGVVLFVNGGQGAVRMNIHHFVLGFF